MCSPIFSLDGGCFFSPSKIQFWKNYTPHCFIRVSIPIGRPRGVAKRDSICEGVLRPVLPPARPHLGARAMNVPSPAASLADASVRLAVRVTILLRHSIAYARVSNLPPPTCGRGYIYSPNRTQAVSPSSQRYPGTPKPDQCHNPFYHAEQPCTRGRRVCAPRPKLGSSSPLIASEHPLQGPPTIFVTHAVPCFMEQQPEAGETLQ